MTAYTTGPSSSSPPAGLIRRLAAIAYDTLLLVAVLFIATTLVLPLTGGEAMPRGNPYYSAYLFFVCFLFFGWFWTHGGQTLGMRAWKIRVQQTDGDDITWLQALVRFLAAVVSWLALGMGFLWMLVDQDRMTWHDRFSDTVLVVIKR
jgi:uncharacterized RDD family membrane protein YckC